MNSPFPYRFSPGDSVRMKDPSVFPPHSGMEILYGIVMTVVECYYMPQERIEAQAARGEVVQTQTVRLRLPDGTEHWPASTNPPPGGEAIWLGDLWLDPA